MDFENPFSPKKLSVLYILISIICGPVLSEIAHPIPDASNGNLAASSTKDIHYLLYTRKNPQVANEIFVDDVNSIAKSNLFANAPLVVVTHGFSNSGNISQEFIWDLKNAYLNVSTGDLNIILVDWSKLAKGPIYANAVANVPVVGQQDAKLIQFLVKENKAQLGHVHLVGHSLGAHVAGDTGYYVQKLMGGKKVARITGLDPAKPLFTNVNDTKRLDATDGEFVDVIHTAGASLGLFDPLGQVDFYPNGGLHQPNCSGLDFVQCDHKRAPLYFIESVYNPKGFRSCKCTREAVTTFLHVPQFRPQYCSCNGTDATASMGEDVSQSARGIFYLKTNKRPPYAMG